MLSGNKIALVGLKWAIQFNATKGWNYEFTFSFQNLEAFSIFKVLHRFCGIVILQIADEKFNQANIVD